MAPWYRRRASALALVWGIAGLAPPAPAQVAMAGVFVAERACPATRAIRSRDNPGSVVLAPGRAYDLVGINKAGGSHYQIVVPGVPAPERRWVAVSCGSHREDGGNGRDGGDRDAATPESTENLLAASWQPAFCETRPRVPECRRLAADPDAPAARAFSIHGLWPQPRGREYCGVPQRLRTRSWSALPEPDVDAATAAALDVAMPGRLSDLDNHEWLKHGTCYGAAGGADEYYDDTLWLIGQLNASGVRALFETAIGGSLTVGEIRTAFDAAFGTGAGRRVALSCRDGLIVEMRLHLRGRIEAGRTPLGDLLRAADPVGRGCRGGRVDRAG